MMLKNIMAENDLDLKFLVIGDSGVGKTCLLRQYVDERLDETLAPTVGIDIRDKNILYKSTKSNKSFNIHLQIWDTAGQERFRSLTASFFRDAMGFLLVFDLTNEKSFLNVRNWIGEIHSNAYSEDVDLILVGNKCDLEGERIISKAQAQEFASQNNVDYIETSALMNINVAESVELLLDAVMESLTKNQDLSSITNQYPRKVASVPLTQENLANHSRKPTKNSYCCSY